MSSNDLSGSQFASRTTQISSSRTRDDIEEFREDIAEFGLSEKAETEFLLSLAHIMHVFARFGIEMDVCGLIFSDFNEAAGHLREDGTMNPTTNTEKPSDEKEGGDGNG